MKTFPHAKLKNVKLTNNLRRNIPDGRTPKQYNEGLAERYALWLAKRDRIEVDHKLVAKCRWDGFSDHAGKWQKRISAVEFGRYCGPVWRGASFESKVTIEIPHWDFDPVIIDETPIAAQSSGECHDHR